jgi:hypothetical protein
MKFALLVTAFIVYLVLSITETDAGYHFFYVLGLVYVTGHLAMVTGIAIGLAHTYVEPDKRK